MTLPRVTIVGIKAVEHIEHRRLSDLHAVFDFAVGIETWHDVLVVVAWDEEFLLVEVRENTNGSCQTKVLGRIIDKLGACIHVVLTNVALCIVDERKRIRDNEVGVVAGTKIIIIIGAQQGICAILRGNAVRLVGTEQRRTTIGSKERIGLQTVSLLLVCAREVGEIDVCIDLPFLAHEDVGIDLCLEAVARSILQNALVSGITEGDVVLGNGIATLDTEQVIVGHRIAVDGILPIGVELIEVGIVGCGA